jgi:hypothetical protein
LSNPWANLIPTNGAYFELKNEGDSFEATIASKSVESVDFKDGLPAKDRPRVDFLDEGDGAKHYVFTNAVAANAVISLDPQVGERIRVTRGSKLPGSKAIGFTIERVDNAKGRPAPAAGAPKPASNEAPF